MTWTPLLIGGHFTSLFFQDAKTGYAAGVQGIIFKTIDGGDSWTLESSDTLYMLNSIFFPDKRTGYAAGTKGTILKTTNAESIIVPNPSLNPGVSIYPNPAKQKLIVKINGIKEGEMTLTIFSTDSRRLLEFKCSIKDRNEFDVNSLTPGTYIVQICQGKYYYFKKLIIK